MSTEAKPMDVDPPSSAKAEQAPEDTKQDNAAEAPASASRARRNRKQVEFFSPDPIGSENEKLVVKEVCTRCVKDL